MARDVMSVRLHLLEIQAVEVPEDSPGRTAGEDRAHGEAAAVPALRVPLGAGT